MLNKPKATQALVFYGINKLKNLFKIFHNLAMSL